MRLAATSMDVWRSGSFKPTSRLDNRPYGMEASENRIFPVMGRHPKVRIYVEEHLNDARLKVQ
jgi:hypothetical protein